MSDWKECTWIEAANAFAAGTHEYESSFGRTATWAKNGVFHTDKDWHYRIREKAITVTIPRPERASATLIAQFPNAFAIGFATSEQRDTALAAIRAAMEQQQ